MTAWADTYVGQIAAKFPQYDFINGGVESYAPSNYLNVTRQLLDRGLKFDEVIVFIDMSDAQDEAAFYQDKDPSGAVGGPAQIIHNGGFYTGLRSFVKEHLLVTNSVFDRLERLAVKHGIYRSTSVMASYLICLVRPGPIAPSLTTSLTKLVTPRLVWKPAFARRRRR